MHAAPVDQLVGARDDVSRALTDFSQALHHFTRQLTSPSSAIVEAIAGAFIELCPELLSEAGGPAHVTIGAMPAIDADAAVEPIARWIFAELKAANRLGI